jgi:Rad3-related DNA helicase
MAIKVEDNLVQLSVRDLINPSRPQKMLSSFPLPQRGMLGKQAQTKVQQQKNRSYGLFHREYFVRREYDYNNYKFILQGRIDGVYQLKNKIEIEEIKSVILNSGEFKNLQVERYPEFIDQVLFYAYLLQDELDGVEVSAFIVLINLINDAKRSFPVVYNRLRVERLLLNRFSGIIANIERERLELERRKAELSLINFDLSENRPQQQKMMKTVETCLKEKKHLMVSAPTGTGKTAAVLYPAIQYAYANNKKIFFVTSKTTQQRIVRETIQPLTEQGLDLKALFLRAAEKMCPNNIYFCHEAYCPYAQEYDDRLLESNILADLMNNPILTPELIYQASVEKKLCPFEVSMDLCAYADIIVGDYNYVFDPAVYLRRLFAKKDFSDWILVVDETHNLYERGISYLSPQIKRKAVLNLIKQHKNKKAKVFQDLTKSLNEIDGLFESLNLEGEMHYSNRQYFQADLNVKAWDDAHALFESAFIKYLIHKIKKRMLIIEDPVEDIFYKMRRFVQVAHFQDRAFVPFYDAQEGGILKIQCCDPSNYLGQKIDGFHGVTAMSATLDPIKFYQTVLGFPEYRTEILQLGSPFPAEHRKIIIAPGISTRYKDRAKNYPKIAEIIEKTIRHKKGNYLVFFPSFDFIQNVNLFLGKVRYEKILQRPGMNENERDEILKQLKQSQDPHLLLAVMGGIFSEGVDFAGDMAIGVIIVSPALPKIGFERELLKQYYDEKHNLGMEYAYIYPGINKVIQSVGRLIRSTTDKGIVVLIGERFADEQFNSILPEYWFKKKGDVEITREYEESVKTFWKRFD